MLNSDKAACSGIRLCYVGFVHHFILAAITCSALTKLVSGIIDYSQSSNSVRYSYGTTASYQCNSGYNRTGGDTERTCTGNGSTSSGRWDGTAPQCPRMFHYLGYIYVTVCMIMYTHSCGLWNSSVYYQWISWDTNNHNIHRDSDLQL